MYVGVLAVQNETTAGRNRIGTGGPGVYGAHHVHGFAANNVYPSDINSFLGHMGSGIPKIMYAALGPTALSTTNPWVDPNQNRLVDTNACVTFANQCGEYIAANATITHANFWNEMKGYNWGNDATNRALFNSHYIAWATRMRVVAPGILLGGPYSTGGLSVSTLRLIHESFRDNVVKTNPGLVDFICWDHSGAEESAEGKPAHQFYTDIYTQAPHNITLPHMDSEWYPGGWNTGSPPSVGNYARIICRIATNPYMQFLMHWSGGSDPAMKTVLYNSSGTPTAYWTALNKVADFVRHGGVTTLSADSWRNAANQTLTVSGDTITVVATGSTVPANAILRKGNISTFTVDALFVVGASVWVSPANNAQHTATPTFVFNMPQSANPMYFDLNLDTVNTFGGSSFRRYSSYLNQTGWEYFNGSTWVAHPSTGIPAQYGGNQARFTVSDPLEVGTWYRRIRGLA